MDNKVFDITDARCNREVQRICVSREELSWSILWEFLHAVPVLMLESNEILSYRWRWITDSYRWRLVDCVFNIRSEHLIPLVRRKVYLVYGRLITIRVTNWKPCLINCSYSVSFCTCYSRLFFITFKVLFYGCEVYSKSAS